jgi:hypothetical protein
MRQCRSCEVTSLTFLRWKLLTERTCLRSEHHGTATGVVISTVCKNDAGRRRPICLSCYRQTEKRIAPNPSNLHPNFTDKAKLGFI